MPARKYWDYLQQDVKTMREDDKAPESVIKEIMDERLKKLAAGSTVHRGKKDKKDTAKFKKGGMVRRDYCK